MLIAGASIGVPEFERLTELSQVERVLSARMADLACRSADVRECVPETNARSSFGQLHPAISLHF